MASFHPSTTISPYIQYGTWAIDDTVLRFASTKYASASRLNRVAISRCFDSENTTKDAAKSNSSSASGEASGGKLYSREGSIGEILENRGMSNSVYTYLSAICCAVNNHTHLIFGLAEGTFNVIIRFPHPRNPLFIISESFFEVHAKLAEDGGICRQLVDLGAQYHPSTCTKR